MGEEACKQVALFSSPPLSSSGMAAAAHSFTIDASAVVPRDAVLLGSGSIGPQCVVHPTATLDGRKGPLHLAVGSVVEDRAVLAVSEEGKELRCGEALLVSVGAKVAAASIGARVAVGIGAQVLSGAVLGSGVSIGARCVVAAGDEVPDATVVFGEASERRHDDGFGEEHARALGKHVDLLAKTMPNFHHLQK